MTTARPGTAISPATSATPATALASRDASYRGDPQPVPPPGSIPAPRCLLRIACDDSGIISVLTGFGLLARQRLIDLQYEMLPECPPLEHGPWHLRDKPITQIELIVDGRVAILDTHDGFEIDPEEVASCDVYFKRSLRPDAVPPAGVARVLPLGLTSKVRADGFDLFEAGRILRSRRPPALRANQFARWFAESVRAVAGAGQRPNLSRMQLPPAGPGPERVLCMAQLWDPELVPDWVPEKRAEFEAINEMRVACIRALRRAFGARFQGGIRPSAFARRYAPDVVLPNEAAAKQREFLRQVAAHPVCVTTAGLHGSTGTRMAELVAFSRAIVSERVPNVAPGGFGAGANYLEFDTPERCVEQVAWLFDHPRERAAMMERNWGYYCDWLRPDRLAWRLVALTRAR